VDLAGEGGVLGEEVSEFASQGTQLEFLAKLQRILGEGQFVASYKYALLLALAELSVEKLIAPDGALRIELDELADRFVTLYWRQVAPFRGRNVLLQATGQQAAIIRKITALKTRAPTLAVARKQKDWARLVRQVGALLDQMPLWRLQLVGAERVDFLYEERLVDRSIVLRPGIAACFRAQFAIVQALVQMAWLSFVQRLPLNRPILGSTTDLADFLFGAERTGLRVIADGLLELQKGGCFYCGDRIRDSSAVDHFIPWSRYPLDLGHNFVLAHNSCNQDKRDMLAASAHLERWVARNDGETAALREVFERARFPHDADASLSVAEWAYENAERAGALVWVRKGQTDRLSEGWRDWFK
jgi:hypothetical protein